ncbi:hypothetical protein [Corynebacterium halotolerans]|uniref:Secreted protein n=1 Tax=Corynebacterium halotolerans YIM 70093 = DSM 44683 TaxID=1121362 RepID=M1NTP2_9CORY|nr:hypothetical protein [Corynebacterium halotolerans]AGF72847.1 hypothetical protein A605_09225 [Corynebacterium halotolerans YIM 70093 = DSM 44683]
MSLSATAKKTFVALVLAAPLTLVACGSEAEEPAEDTATTTTAETSATTTEETTTEEATTEETSTEEAPEEDPDENSERGREVDPAPQGAAADPQGETVTPDADPAAALDEAFSPSQLNYAQLAPVESGGPANEADRAAIEGLLRGMYETTTVHNFLRYLPDNTCSAVLDAQGDREAYYDFTGIPDMPLNQLPTYVNAQPRIDSVTDVRVDGDTASATVTASSGGETETATQRFQREGGTWKFCN